MYSTQGYVSVGSRGVRFLEQVAEVVVEGRQLGVRHSYSVSSIGLCRYYYRAILGLYKEIVLGGLDYIIIIRVLYKSYKQSLVVLQIDYR